jgi:hypothetical protein
MEESTPEAGNRLTSTPDEGIGVPIDRLDLL